MNSRRKNRLLLWAGLGTVTVLAFGYAFWPRGVAVDVAVAERGSMLVTLDEEGETRIHDVYTVSSPLTGEITRIDAEPGDRVEAGTTVLAVIHPIDPSLLDARSQSEREAQVRSAESAVNAARAQVESAKSEFEFAKADLARARKLTPRDTISARDLERFESNLKVKQSALSAASATLDVRRSELDAARASLIGPERRGPIQLDPVNITSPVDGRVLRVLHRSEGVVAAAEPLVEIGDVDRLEAVADYLSTDAVQIHPGDAVLIEDWGGSGVLHGHVERIEPYAFTKVSALGIEEQRVNVVINFDSPLQARSRLGHGYRIEARVVAWQGKDILQAPLGSIFRDRDKWSVFVVRGGRARLQNVEIGHRGALAAEILSGINPGEVLIVHPSDRVKNGVLVAIRRNG